jgi:hypothetical protein
MDPTPDLDPALDSDPTPDLAPDPGILVNDLQDKKSQRKSQNSRNKGFSYYYCLIIEGSEAGSAAWIRIFLAVLDPDPFWECGSGPIASHSL